jgi:hypothetical protein
LNPGESNGFWRVLQRICMRNLEWLLLEPSKPSRSSKNARFARIPSAVLWTHSVRAIRKWWENSFSVKSCRFWSVRRSPS